METVQFHNPQEVRGVAPKVTLLESDVAVIEVATLDAEFAKQFSKPWLCEHEDGRKVEFATEDEACAYQRQHRLANGMHPRTGDPTDIRFAYKPGDVMCWTNDYGVKWHAVRIVELAEFTEHGPQYFVEPNDAPWASVHEENLQYETLSLADLQACLPHEGTLRRRLEKDPGYLAEVSKRIAEQQAMGKP